MMTRDEQVVLVKAAAVIETLGKQNDWLTEQLAIALHEKQATKLAHTMVDKGLIAATDLEKKASELTQDQNLDIVKKAIELNEAGFNLGSLEKQATVEGSEGAELDPLTQYLVDHIHGR
jgi:hypothetical protein